MPMKTTLNIEGMHCPACVKRLTTAFQGVPGVTAARVTLTPPAAEIESGGPLALVALSEAARGAGTYTVSEADPGPPPNAAAPRLESPNAAPAPRPSLYPLVLIVAYIAGAVALATYSRGPWSWHAAMNDFMAGFFLVFSFFKLLDLRGFADAYRSYDILARPFGPWAFAYPFVELALGIAYLVRWQPTLTNAVTLALMLVGSVGVLRALLRKDHIRCACLGTALNLPMTTVTLVEDLGMAAMAGAALIWSH